MPDRHGAMPGRHQRPAAPRSRRPHPGRTVALVIAAVLAVLASTGMPAAATVAPAATPAQDETTSTVADEDAPSTTTEDLLNGPVTAPTTAAASTTIVPGGPGNSPDNDDTGKVWAIVIGLVAVAVALTVLTVGYWYRTRPVGEAAPSLGPPDGYDDREGEEGGAARRRADARPGARFRPPTPGPRPVSEPRQPRPQPRPRPGAPSPTSGAPRPGSARRGGPSAGATSATTGKPDGQRQRPIRARRRDDADR